MKKANYEIVSRTDKLLVIRDVGPWHNHPSVTNAVAEVVAHLYAGRLLDNECALHYFDSDGKRGTILHHDGLFLGFGPGSDAHCTKAPAREYISLRDFSQDAREGFIAIEETYDGPDPSDLVTPEAWAWYAYQLRVTPDKPRYFPKGKWATIQHLESMLLEIAQRHQIRV